MQHEFATPADSETTLAMSLEDPRSCDGREIIHRFFADIVGRYWERTATDAEVERAMLDEPSDDLHGDRGFLVVVRDGEQLVGCGGVRVVAPGVGELTRVFVDTSTRGRGTGKALIREIESISALRGIQTLRLTVRGDLTEAHRLYQRLGYEPVASFSTSPYADHQLAKKLHQRSG